MKIPWRDTRCIICLNEDVRLSTEHLIPQALGGRLTCDFLCRACNSRLGYNLEASVRSDPAVLLAAKNLSGRVPKLPTRLIENHPHVGRAEHGPVPGYMRNGEFRAKPCELGDGSIVQAKDRARESIATMLRRSGQAVAPALAAFDGAPENKRVEIAPGLDIAHWTVHDIELDLNTSQSMDQVVPVKIAFEFLAICVGTAVYGGDAQLSEVRRVLTTCNLDSDAIKVERRHSGQYKPFHGICIDTTVPHVTVQVRLFGWLAFLVHFHHLCVDESFVYTHALDSASEDLRCRP